MNKIENEFFNQAYMPGSILLFDAETAIKFVKRCKEENVKILGLDGFFVQLNVSNQPSTEHAIDFSSENFKLPKGISEYEFCINFIKKHPSIYFEIVCKWF